MASVAPDFVDATIGYLAPDSRINRFFWAPEGRISTAAQEEQRVTVHNARAAAETPTLDRHGFQLVHAPSRLRNFQDPEAVRTIYAREACNVARDLTGADLVLPMGAELRSSNPSQPGMLTPAMAPHVDFDTPTARKIAKARYRKRLPDGPGYERFILFSLWRTWSPGPQDWPLALCDFESAKDDPEIRNVRIKVDTLPEGEARFAPVDGEAEMGASGLFMHNPAHRWWFYPGMTVDEAIFIKFHDSDRSRAWRALHTAFHDAQTPGTHPRQSIEFRGCAYFAKG